MTETVLGIYNAAISAAEGKGRLTSLSQASVEREECDTWYSSVRDTVQEAAFWPCCKTMSRLALEATRDYTVDWQAGMPYHPYKYMYALPNDYLRAWYLSDYSQFELIYDSVKGRTMLHTNMPNAVLIYARSNDLPGQWTPSQRQATIYGLAAHIVNGISGRTRTRETNIQLANTLLENAQAVALGSQDYALDVIPPAILARGAADQLPTRYYYPHGGLFQLGAGVNA